MSPRVVLIDDAERDRADAASYLVGLGYRMDGIQVLRRLRATAATRAVYVIVTSGHAGARERQRAFEAGCNQYVVKPFTLASLGHTLYAYFWKRGIALAEG